MKNRTLLIALGVGVAVLVLSYVLLFRPQSSSLDEAHARTDAAEQTNDELQLRLSRLQAAQANEPELTAELEALRVAIPDDPSLAQFILDANDASQASGVEFLSISPSEPEPDAALGVSVVNLSIAVNGGYFQTLDYLNRLLALQRIVVIDSFDLAPGTEAGVTTLAVSLAARMFTTATDAAGTTGTTGTTATTAPGETTTTTAPGETTTTTTGGTP